MTGAYRIGSRARKPIGSGNYAGRKSHLRAHPVEAVVRWERFDDDGMTRKLGARTLRDRVAAGGRYAFFESGKILAYSEAEYRHVARRIPASSSARLPDGNDEVYLRLGLDF